MLAGITPNGVIKSNVRKVSTERVRVFEYGFSFALSRLLPEKLSDDIRDPEKKRYVFLNIAKNFSPTSCLLTIVSKIATSGV
jgi:CRISPR/Cas system-associated protein Csm6